MQATSVINQLSEDRLVMMESQHGFYLPMLKIAKFVQSDIHISLPSDPFPAFVVDGIEKDHIYISQFTYPSTARSTPVNNIHLEDARAQALALGTGFHLLTGWEWAAFAWSMKDLWGTERGPTEEEGFVSSGAGSFFWRTPSEWWGMWGMCGNLYEYCDGVQLRADKVFGTPQNNLSHLNNTDSIDPTYWPELGTIQPHANSTLDLSPVNGQLLQLLLLSNGALTTNPPQGQSFAANSSSSLVLERGGAYHSGLEAGLGCYRFQNTSLSSQIDSGFRIAYID